MLRWLLYDVHKRGLFMDAMRIIFPFGEAWKEVITRWLALVGQRPGTVIQRGHQILKAAGHDESWEDVQQDPSQHGFMFENANGEAVFTYPSSRWFTAAVTGVPVELTGALNGLTLMNSVIPGVGPVVQVGASFFPALRESPEFDKWREIIFPFGMSDFDTLPVDTILSPGARRFLEGIAAGGLAELRIPGTEVTPVPEAVSDVLSGAARIPLLGKDPETDRLFLNSVFDVMRYNVSTGNYTTDSPAAIQTLIRDSTAQAGAFSMIRGLAQFTAPSAPIPEFYVEDQDGSLLMLRALSAIYYDLQAEDYTTAAQTFLNRYGQNLSLLIQAKTVPRSALLPSTTEADQWLRGHPGFQEEYPNTFGLYVPGNNEADAEFDFNAYSRAIATGATRTLGGGGLTIENLVDLANDRAASLVFDEIEAELLDTPRFVTESGNLNEDGQHYLSTQVVPWLQDTYPGFRSDALQRGPSTEDLRTYGMAEARTASEDDRVDEPLRNAIRDYLDVHDEVMATAQSAAYDNASTYYESDATRPLRDYMRFSIAPLIREQLPEDYRGRWDALWDRLFDRVMYDDPESAEAEGVAA